MDSCLRVHPINNGENRAMASCIFWRPPNKTFSSGTIWEPNKKTGNRNDCCFCPEVAFQTLMLGCSETDTGVGLFSFDWRITRRTLPWDTPCQFEPKIKVQESMDNFLRTIKSCEASGHFWMFNCFDMGVLLVGWQPLYVFWRHDPVHIVCSSPDTNLNRSVTDHQSAITMRTSLWVGSTIP